MTNLTQNLEFKYDNNEIKINCEKKEIQPGKTVIIRIEDIKNNTILNINNYSIQIEKTGPPKIAKNQNKVYCIFEGKKICDIRIKIIYLISKILKISFGRK